MPNDKGERVTETSRADEIIATNDPEKILAMAMGAWLAADEGRFCECEEPALTGYDLMCGNCLLENEGQREKRMRRARDPHPFQPRGETGLKARMCEICTMWKDDPRHD